MNTLILGHSYIHRLNAYLHSPKNTNLLSNTANHNITCIGEGGAFFDGRKYNCLRHKGNLHLSSTNTQILIVALGTNDLDRGMAPDKVAWRLYLMAAGLQIEHHIRYVFIEQILYRDPVKFPDFNWRADAANEKVQHLVTNLSNTRVRYWEHRNFKNPRRPLICGDGVHLNQVGMAKYWRSLRGAILYAERH